MSFRRFVTLALLAFTACDRAPQGGAQLVLSNETSQPLFVARSGNCGSTPWFALADERGDVVVGERPCISRCGDQPIACLLACSRSVVERIEPGAVERADWDGGFDRVIGDLGPACLDEDAALVGETFQARFCWGTGKADDPESVEVLTGKTCETKSFVIGRDLEVKVSVR